MRELTIEEAREVSRQVAIEEVRFWFGIGPNEMFADRPRRAATEADRG